MTRNSISLLRNRSLFLFTDEEMNPRQDANRDEVLSFFTPLANNIVAKIQICKGNSILEIGSYKVWIKKLDDNGMPWVNITKSSTKRIYQKAEGEDTLPMLILGYQLDEVERVSHIYILYLEGDQHLWAPIDIGDIAASNQISMITNTSGDEPIVTVKPEKQRGEEAV